MKPIHTSREELLFMLIDSFKEAMEEFLQGRRANKPDWYLAMTLRMAATSLDEAAELYESTKRQQAIRLLPPS